MTGMLTPRAQSNSRLLAAITCFAISGEVGMVATSMSRWPRWRSIAMMAALGWSTPRFMLVPLDPRIRTRGDHLSDRASLPDRSLPVGQCLPGSLQYIVRASQKNVYIAEPPNEQLCHSD